MRIPRNSHVIACFGAALVIAVACTDVIAPRTASSPVKLAADITHCDTYELEGYWEVTGDGLPENAVFDVWYDNGNTYVTICYYDDEDPEGGGGGGGGVEPIFCSSETEWQPECEENDPGGGEQPPETPPACDLIRSLMIAEYRERPVIGWVPLCSAFANEGGTTHFTWSEMNDAWSQGSGHPPWGRFTVGAKLEAARTNYGNNAIEIAGGYRCPHGNASIAGAAPTSRHMFGVAADLFSVPRSIWTEAQFNLMRTAVNNTGDIHELFFWNTYADHHLHVAWY